MSVFYNGRQLVMTFVMMVGRGPVIIRWKRSARLTIVSSGGLPVPGCHDLHLHHSRVQFLPRPVDPGTWLWSARVCRDMS